MTIDRAKWNGKDWRKFCCVDCGYFFVDSQQEESPRLCRTFFDRPACPDFELRKLLDPLTYDPEATDDTGGP